LNLDFFPLTSKALNVNRNPTILIVAFSAVVIIVVAVIAGNAARNAWQHEHRAEQPRETTAAPYDERAAMKAAETIAPAMIGYGETGGFAVPFRELRAMAVAIDDRIYVAGDRGVAIFSSEGEKLSEIALKGEPHCLVVGDKEHGLPGHIYVGMKDHVEVFDPKGERVAIWPSQGGDAFFTSIAAGDYEIWVADSGNRVVWCYDRQGKALTPLGKSNSIGGTEFTPDDHYFDVAMGRDDLLYVSNPGQLRVEAYTREGTREALWGKGSPAVADFFGCCNPAHIAVLPDGNFVTAEKGIPRVKVYSRRGEFQTVVAGPDQLSETPVGLGGDHKGRVFVLDSRAAKVRIFERKPEAPKETGSGQHGSKKENP
jgi:DNA-binding beta-propeller fold protein YncE